jgi:DNA-binding response OmpR family regulator
MNKILIITKDLQLSRLLNYTLSFYGFIVESASSPEAALKNLEEIHFSLILMDFNLKGTKQEEFYLELQNLGTTLPVIVMGEYYEEVSIVDQMYAGMDDYVLKPFNMTELKMVINKQLERKLLLTRPIILGDLRIDVARSLVTVKDKIVSLGRKEREILTILAKKAGKL